MVELDAEVGVDARLDLVEEFAEVAVEAGVVDDQVGGEDGMPVATWLACRSWTSCTWGSAVQVLAHQFEVEAFGVDSSRTSMVSRRSRMVRG